MAAPKTSKGGLRRVTLPIVGAETQIDLPVPGGRAGLTAILPAMRRLSAAMMGVAEAEARKAGRKVSCKAGCGACCKQLVPISVVEAKSLAVTISKMPAPRQKTIRKRFDVLLARLEEARLLPPKGDEPRTGFVTEDDGESSMWESVSRRYFGVGVDCPFLENQSCSIYEDRPLVCREYLVTSDPQYCGALDPRAEPVARPAYLTPAMGAVVTELEGISPGMIPLALALEWFEGRGDELTNEHDCAEALEIALGALEWNEEDVRS